jgi:hypothetical protein
LRQCLAALILQWQQHVQLKLAIKLSGCIWHLPPIHRNIDLEHVVVAPLKIHMMPGAQPM